MSAGVTYAVVAAVLFGMSTPLARLLVGQMDPVLLAGLLYLGSGVGLFAWSRVRPSTDAPLRKSDLPWLAGSVLAGGIAGPLLLLLGLQRSSAGAASLTLNLEGVFTTLLAWFVFGEHFDRRIAAGMAFIVGGGVVLSWNGDGSAMWGLAFVALACLAWALDNNLTRAISTGDPQTIAMVKGGVAGAVNTAVALFALQTPLPTPAIVAAAGLLGLVCFGASLRFYVLALRELGTARTGAYFSIAPFVGAALSVPLLGEPVTARFLCAGALMVIGIWIHLTEDHAHEHHHDYLDHEHEHTHDEHHRHVHEGEGGTVAHAHRHVHVPHAHVHPHFPDIHHRHGHEP